MEKKQNNRPVYWMVFILLVMAGWFLSVCFAYRNGFVDADNDIEKWKSNEVEMLKNDNCTLRCMIENYENYVDITEHLLDSLDHQYGWSSENWFAAPEYHEILHIINDHGALDCEQN